MSRAGTPRPTPKQTPCTKTAEVPGISSSFLLGFYGGKGGLRDEGGRSALTLIPQPGKITLLIMKTQQDTNSDAHNSST